MSVAKTCKLVESAGDTTCTALCDTGYTDWVWMRGYEGIDVANPQGTPTRSDPRGADNDRVRIVIL
jgi:hypothetical protein